MKNLNICIAGLGNVGSAVVSLIEKNSQYIKNKSNLTINIIGLSAKNRDKERNFNVRDYKWIENPIDLLNINDLKPDRPGETAIAINLKRDTGVKDVKI